MKKLFVVSLMLSWVAVTALSQTVTFKFQDGLYKERLKTTMESRISALLTEINQAGKENRNLSLAGKHLTERSLRSLKGQWNSFHFVCVDTVNVESCLEDVNGYEVRGIPMTIKPIDSAYNGVLYKELVIRFDKSGLITSVHMALDNNTITEQIGSEVRDKRLLHEMLNFVEEYRSYYDEKDLTALNDVFSDDALIITGTVVARRNLGSDRPTLKTEVRYKKQNKKQYLKKLKELFASNSYIKVVFDSVKIVKHGSKEGFYGVTLRQSWNSENYSDVGYVFLLWEFPETGDERARIHVRTWQPLRGPYDPNGEMREIKEDEIFNHHDFEIN